MRASDRRAIIVRAGGCCEYCRSPHDFATQSFAVEHITPRHLGGTDVRQNLALACDGCNEHKYTKTTAPDPFDGTIVPLFHPRQHRWREHFRWSEDFTLVIGQTAIGRATVKALHLNPANVVNLRAVLRATGHHPRSIPADHE